MFTRLGEIMYAISDDGDATTHLIKQFMEEFKEQKEFIDYFRKTWCHDERRIGKIIYIIHYIIYLFLLLGSFIKYMLKHYHTLFHRNVGKKL